MTSQEHKSIAGFIQSAVADGQPAMDLEADAIIRALFVRNPDAAYRVTVLAMQSQEMLKNQQTLPDHRLAATASPKLFGGLLRRWQARGLIPQAR